MGLFDLFRRRAEPATEAAPAPAATVDRRRFHQDRARMFDLERTKVLAQLLAVPGEVRDQNWSERFFDAVWTASLVVPPSSVISGPDGMPYLRLELPPAGVPFDSQCLANVAARCLDDHCGAALFAAADDPPEAAHYVFSMGLIDSLLRYDSPDGDPMDVADMARPVNESMFEQDGDRLHQRLTVAKAHSVLLATPSASYLPPQLAHGLWRYLTQVWKLEDPRVLLLTDLEMRPTRTLVISRKRSEFAPGDDVELMIRYLHWYLNPGRMLMLMPEDWRLGDMTPLRQLF